MKALTPINIHTAFLFFLSLILNFCLLEFNYNDWSYCTGYKIMLAEPAYDFYRNNSTYFNNERCKYLHSLLSKEHKLLEYAEIDHSQFGESKDRLIVAITPWYSILLGSLWKLTDSLSYKDIIYLQIFLFSFCLMLLYMIAFMLFESEAYALGVGLSTLLFFPLVFHNVLVIREIWPFYGIVLIIYGLLSYFYQEGTLAQVLVGGIFFALCQLMRPQALTSLIFLLCFCFLGTLFSYINFKKFLQCSGMLISSNIICFWLPFMAYNKVVYDRYVVSSVGEILLEGLGEQENKWGYQWNDSWFADFMQKQFGLKEGTPECDEKARELFFRSIYEEPLFYIKSIRKRIFKLILPDFVWCPALFNDAAYTRLTSVKERIVYLYSHSSTFIGFLKMFFSHLYVRLYVMIAYLGLLLMFLQGYGRISLLLLTLLTSSWFVVFLHLEDRYVLYSFGFLPFSFAYCGWYVYKKLAQLISKYFLNYSYY